MPIYTKKGDEGTTGLLGGVRLSKNDPIFEALGSIDELNAQIGMSISLLEKEAPQGFKDLILELKFVQDRLFSIGSNVASIKAVDKQNIPSRPTERDITKLERSIDKYDEVLKPLQNFILPGGAVPAAHLHIARGVCRRAERRLFALHSNSTHQKFLNRLSDYLFTAARITNYYLNQAEAIWTPKLIDKK